MLIITNNKMVVAFLDGHKGIRCEVRWVDGNTEDVLKKVRDLCHMGWKLLTHPLSGSVKPNQTPFKTVVLAENAKGCDINSIEIAETAYNKTLSMLKDRARPFIAEKILEDLAVIDFDLFKNHLRNVNLY